MPVRSRLAGHLATPSLSRGSRESKPPAQAKKAAARMPRPRKKLLTVLGCRTGRAPQRDSRAFFRVGPVRAGLPRQYMRTRIWTEIALDHARERGADSSSTGHALSVVFVFAGRRRTVAPGRLGLNGTRRRPARCGRVSRLGLRHRSLGRRVGRGLFCPALAGNRLLGGFLCRSLCGSLGRFLGRLLRRLTC